VKEREVVKGRYSDFFYSPIFKQSQFSCFNGMYLFCFSKFVKFEKNLSFLKGRCVKERKVVKGWHSEDFSLYILS
jgi:hypothetical protein